MSNNMERPVDSQLLEKRAKSKAELEKLLARIDAEHQPKPKTLEQMFGPEKAARMRHEAEIVNLATPEESKPSGI